MCVHMRTHTKSHSKDLKPHTKMKPCSLAVVLLQELRPLSSTSPSFVYNTFLFHLCIPEAVYSSLLEGVSGFENILLELKANPFI